MKKNGLFIYLMLFGLHFRAFALRPADDSLKTKKAPAEYTVTPLEGINTKNAEFCAVPYMGGVLFVTDQLKDLVNNESLDVNGFPYVDVFSAELTNLKAEKIAPFSKKINGPYHDGPVSFSFDRTKLYLTRVEYVNKRSSKFVNRAKLFVFDRTENGGWSQPQPFKYNNDAYSIGHASVSKNGMYLFFASDMPGGKGGKDLYVCKKNGEEWGTPENLGAEINTEGDEEFPYIREDGILFFSSNGHKGLGGFDIYTANLFLGKWRLKRNEGEELNSAGDDFGIVFTDSIHGYFSSNRKGGMGLDDIYRFTFTGKPIDVFATLLLTENINDPSKKTLVYLMNTKGKIIDATFTDEKGFFEFRNLYGDKHYMAAVDPDEIEFKGKARFYLANSQGEIVRISHSYKKNKFVFEDLPLEESKLSDIYYDDDLSLSGALSHGSNPATFIKNARLSLMNTFGDIVDTTVTDALGYFVFKNLASNQDYVVTINDSSLHLPNGTTVTMTDKDGKKLKNFVVGKEAFAFRLLSHEKSVMSDLVTDEELSFEFNNCTYGQDKLELKAVKYKKIYLMNSKGEIIDSLITNGKGSFKFKNLDVDKEYMASVEEGALNFVGKPEYYLVDKKGNVVKVSYPFKNKRFAFKNIPLDSLSLQELAVDDQLLLAGNLRFGPRGENPVKNVRIYLLNSKGIVIDSIITNEFGCFSFRNVAEGQNYSVNINEADMNLPIGTKVILTEKNGKIAKVFYAGKDRFEYRILSAEKNILSDMETSDNELVMKLSGYVYNSNRKPLADASVILYDAKGNKSQVATTDSTGRYIFRNAKSTAANRIEITTKNPADSVLFISDSKKKVFKELKKNSSGTFDYTLLEVDKVMMADYTVDDPWLEVIEMKSASESVIIVERIFYHVNDFKLDLAGQQALDKAINVLKNNSNLMMELSSHTDSRANDDYNLKLSNRRAKFAVDYIVSQGIDRSRLKAVGYGEKKLINKCVNDSDCTDEEHALNRRTEFKVTYK